MVYGHTSQADLALGEAFDFVAVGVAAVVDERFVADDQLAIGPGHGVIPRLRLGVSRQKRLTIALPMLAVVAPDQHGVAETFDVTAFVGGQIITQYAQHADEQGAASDEAADAIELRFAFILVVERDDLGERFPMN